MKIHSFVLYILIISVFFSCSHSEKITQTSPKFHFPINTVFTSYCDTLRITGSAKNGFQMDSIAAGDTAVFCVDIDGVFHQLTEINIALSEDSVAELLFLDAAYMDSLFLSSSRPEEGVFYPVENKMRIPFYFRYCAKKASKNVKLTLTAFSEAGKTDHTNQFTLKVPIKKTPAPEFYFPSDTVFTENNDTLRIRYVSSVYRLDALSVGDAVELKIIISGVRNNLKRFTLTPSNRTDVELELLAPAELDQMFLNTSDYENGIFEMDGSFSTLSFPLKLRAKQANEDFSLVFEARSDALYDYGIRRFELKVPIEAIPEEE